MRFFKKSLSIFLICALLISVLTITASAGQAVKTIDSRTYAESLQPATWHNSNADITVKDGKIVFPKGSTADTKLICKEVVEKSEIYNELLNLDTTLVLKTLPAGQSFNVGFALDSIESSIGDAGNIEIEFTNKGGINAAVKIYPVDGETISLKAQNIGSLNSEIKISALLTVDDKITITVNGKTLCSGYKSPDDVVGRIGFMQTGSCAAEVSDMVIKFYNYSLPENTNIDEDFDDGEWNKNIFGSGMNFSAAHPAGVYIGEYKGEGALIVENSLVGWVSTKHQYSNFEMQYDVLYSQNFTITNEDGSTYIGNTTFHSVCFGREYWEVEGWGGDTTGSILHVGMNSGMIYSSGGKDTYGVSEDHKIDAKENSERGYTVKLRMVDGKFTAWLKWLDEKEFGDPFIDVDDSAAPTPTGHIQLIFDSGDNLVLDNLKITNLDAKPNIVEVDFLTNRLPEISHYEYTPSEVIYREAKEEVVKGFNFYIITAIVAAACVVFLGATVLVMFILKKKQQKALLEEASDVEDNTADTVAVTYEDIESSSETEEKADE